MTQWTPTLIPAELPPAVEPELVEPHYRKNGQVIRTTAIRHSEAVCLEPKCPLMWDGFEAFANSNNHCAETGHLVRQYYHAEYVMTINPLHPRHRGKIKTTILPEPDPSQVQDLDQLYAQREDYKEPQSIARQERLQQNRKTVDQNREAPPARRPRDPIKRARKKA